MTHGEDLSSDMHQDSVVLTYLESVLMRRAAAANAGTPANKSDCDGRVGAGSEAEGTAPPSSPAVAAPSRGRLPPPAPSPPPRAARSVPAPNLNLNLKKARLLQSEDWHGAHKRRRVSSADNPEPVLQPTHSTLLASLLQSFSSSLQGHGAAPTLESPTSSPEQGGGDEAGGCRRPGALLDARGGGGGGESSRSGSRNNSPAGSSPSPRLSCSARLKAVASMVGKGPGPGGSSSPKPSAACSQLALLLSSDCQLQQYSRARSLAPSASQRLAAIACKKQVGAPPVGAVTPPRERCQRSPASPASAAGTMAGSGSSLLMHLLNSPKLPATNGHMWGPQGQGGGPTPPRGRLLKEEGEGGVNGGGDPSPRSTCTPMDLSTKPRACDPTTLHPGSLEQMTESLLFSWNPSKVPGLRGPVAKVEQEEEGGPDNKSHHKVTLLQLLLGHPDGAQGEVAPEPSGEAPRPATLGRRPALTEPFPTPAPVAETNHARKPPHTPHAARRPQLFPSPGEPLRKSRPQQEPAKARHLVEQPPATTPPYTKQVFPTPPGGPTTPAAPLAAPDSRLSNFSFSASKLLHDLAHTGTLKPTDPSQVEAEARLSGPSPLEAKQPGAKDSLGFAQGGTGPDLAQLLERRSVLQLLLRNPEKEQTHPGRRMERPESRPYAHAVADVKVKMEPVDEDCDAFPNAKCLRAAPCGAAETVKLEVESPSPPAPAQSATRGGVLSQLLLRHSASPSEAYLSSTLESPPAPSHPHNPCPMTRIRHLLPASPPERRDSQKKPGRTLNVSLNGHSFCPNGMSEPAAGAGSNGSNGNGRAPEPEHRGYLKDAPGFNVLKQLLLSENGIKVLSQHRGLQNGVPARESNHHHHHHHPKPPASTAPGQFYELKMGGKESPVSAELARYPGSARLPQPPRSAGHHEPPWLTKANPILYYMLQRSGGEAQAFGLAEETATAAAVPAAASVSKDRRGQLLRAEAQSRAGPGWVKQEPEESLACFRPHPGQPPLTPGQILEKVAAIKREPD